MAPGLSPGSASSEQDGGLWPWGWRCTGQGAGRGPRPVALTHLGVQQGRGHQPDHPARRARGPADGGRRPNTRTASPGLSDWPGRSSHQVPASCPVLAPKGPVVPAWPREGGSQGQDRGHTDPTPQATHRSRSTPAATEDSWGRHRVGGEPGTRRPRGALSRPGPRLRESRTRVWVCEPPGGAGRVLPGGRQPPGPRSRPPSPPDPT